MKYDWWYQAWKCMDKCECGGFPEIVKDYDTKIFTAKCTECDTRLFSRKVIEVLVEWNKLQRSGSTK